jgi:hypothetical protein
MKTLRILIALCIMLGFKNNAANAQAQTLKDTYYWTSERYTTTCFQVPISGWITQTWMWNGCNRGMNTFSGKLTDTFGNVYLIKDMYAEILIRDKNDVKKVNTAEFTILIHLNGKPVFRVDGFNHITFNANGEVTSIKSEWTGFQCLLD